MQKTIRPGQTRRQRLPKFLYGAVLGAVLGSVALFATPTLAINVLVGMMIIAAYVFFLTHQRRFSLKWSPRTFSPVPVVGALVIGVMSVAGVQYLGMSFAWHPQGKIRKTVQNITTNGPAVDADDAATALVVKPGDILDYTITISNVAPPAEKQYNDMAFTELKDTLPAGIELVSDPSKRALTKNIGTILPGKSVTTVYQVKVVGTTDGKLTENKACYTADSVVKDNPQKGCDIAITKTQVPPTPPPTPPTNPPTPPPTPPTPPTNPPTPPPTPPVTPPVTPPTATPTELPNVGAREVIVVALFAAVSGYLFSALYGYMSVNKAAKRY